MGAFLDAVQERLEIIQADFNKYFDYLVKLAEAA